MGVPRFWPPFVQIGTGLTAKISKICPDWEIPLGGIFQIGKYLGGGKYSQWVYLDFDGQNLQNLSGLGNTLGYFPGSQIQLMCYNCRLQHSSHNLSTGLTAKISKICPDREIPLGGYFPGS